MRELWSAVQVYWFVLNPRFNTTSTWSLYYRVGAQLPERAPGNLNSSLKFRTGSLGFKPLKTTGAAESI